MTVRFCIGCGEQLAPDANGGWIHDASSLGEVVANRLDLAHAAHPSEYESQSARDAQRTGYGGESYWQYLDEAALRHRDYFLRHDEPERAAEMLTRSLSEALMGNDGI